MRGKTTILSAASGAEELPPNLATRQVGEGQRYIRLYQYIMPAQQITTVPLNGRFLDRLIRISAGVTSDSASNPRVAGSSYWGGMSFNVDGAAFNGNALARKNGPESVKVSDQVESALVYQGDVADIGVQASVYGAWARYNHDNDDDTYGDDSTFYSYGGGFALDLYGINVGAGGYHQKIGDFKQTAVNAGIGVGFGPVNTSLTWGQTVALSDSPGIGNPWLVVLSADIGLAPGLSLAGDISYFDNEVDQTGAEILGYSGGDKGWVGIARLGLDF